MRNTLYVQYGDDGAIPVSALHFNIGRLDEASALVMKHHYSRRIPANIQLVGSLHLDGGLFGGDGPMQAAAMFTIPPTRWSEPVLELARLVRADNRVPLTFLLARCASWLKRQGNDLLVSFADKTHGHEGYVYRAANWHYSGCREKCMDGLLVNGSFRPGRSLNTQYGTRSPALLRAQIPHAEIEPHYDEGKHLYWLPLGRKGMQKAVRLGIA